ncbi:MAG: hypothetical protein AB1556_07585 [Bacillota bacterium]
MPIKFCVETITALLQGTLPSPKGGTRQEGFGGWWYSLVEVGGSTPPPGKRAGGHPAYLWCLQWWGGQPPPKPGLTAEQIRELLSRPPGVHSLLVPETITPKKDGGYLYLYVAPHRAVLNWWYSQVTGKTRGKHRLQGDLPLVFATAKTGQDSLKASVGVMLLRQLITDKNSYSASDKASKAECERMKERLRELEANILWVQEFINWLCGWAVKLVGRDDAGLIATQFLLEYFPAVHSPKAYFLKSKPRQDMFTQGGEIITGEDFTGEDLVRQRPRHNKDDGEDEQEESLRLVEKLSPIENAASRLGIKRYSVYHYLRKMGFYKEISSQTTEGGVIHENVRRRYELTEEVIADIERKVKERRKERNKHSALVKLIMEKRGVGIRAAQRWVRRRTEAGKTLEEILREIGYNL